MAVRIAAVLVFVVLAVGAYAGARALGGTAFDEPPAGFPVLRDAGASFRHPPGWRVTTRSAAVTVVAPSGPSRPLGPRLELRRWGDAPDAARRAARAAGRLAVGERTDETAYEIEVPGSDASTSSDVALKLRNGRELRVTTVFARRGGRLITLTARGPVADGPDPRDLAGSLRLDG